jgi:hypothetical protein
MRQRRKRRIRAAMSGLLFVWMLDRLAEALWPWCSRGWRFERIGRAL